MSLSQKQKERLANIQNMIASNLERKKISGRYGFKPERTVFQKVYKCLKVWAQNCPYRAGLDSEPEIHDMLYNLTRIVNSTSDIHGLLSQVTTPYGLEQCQLQLIRGMLDNYQLRSGERLTYNQNILLPTVFSYLVMVS